MVVGDSGKGRDLLECVRGIRKVTQRRLGVYACVCVRSSRRAEIYRASAVAFRDQTKVMDLLRLAVALARS